MLAAALPASANGGEDLLALAEKVNDNWIMNHPYAPGYSWDEAAYYTGNMELYYHTGQEAYLDYAKKWAEKNAWSGDRNQNRASWNNSNVYHADNQTCFQVYTDLYNLLGGEEKISRAAEVTKAQTEEDRVDYWWWCDALYMAMPAFTKLYLATGDERYLSEMYDYYSYTKNLLYDKEEHLFYRDKGYIGGRIDGKKNIWARGTGWVTAALAKTLQELPTGSIGYEDYLATFREMAQSCKNYAKSDSEGRLFFTQSVIPNYPTSGENPCGYETSGTAFIAYAVWWGINAGVLDREEYLPFAEGMLRYITEVAADENGNVGYVQPIGAAATTATRKSDCYNFGVGAVIMALCEADRYYNGESTPAYLEKKMISSAGFKIGSKNMYSGGKVTAFDGGAYISNGSAMIPIRAAAEALGASVLWSEEERSVTVSSKGKSRKFYVGAEAEIRENRTYIPIRAAAEALGLKAYWSDEERIVVIGPRENAFYGCDGPVVKMLSQILDSGLLPEKPKQRTKDFSLHIEEFESDARIHIASAWGDEPEPENGPKNAFDDDLSTRWAGDGTPEMNFDLGEVKYVEKIAASFWKYSERDTSYELWVSEDGVNYDRIFNGQTGRGVMFNYTSVKRNIRYIRIVGHGNTQNSWTSLLEIVPMSK